METTWECEEGFFWRKRRPETTLLPPSVMRLGVGTCSEGKLKDWEIRSDIESGLCSGGGRTWSHVGGMSTKSMLCDDGDERSLQSLGEMGVLV